MVSTLTWSCTQYSDMHRVRSTLSSTKITYISFYFYQLCAKSKKKRKSNVRLAVELSSHRRDTSATRVSEDLQLSIFRHRQILEEAPRS